MNIKIHGDHSGLDYELDLSRGSAVYDLEPTDKQWMLEKNIPICPEGFGVFIAGARHFTTRYQDTSLYQVFYTRAGAAKLTTVSGEYEIGPNSAFLLNLNQPYTYHTTGDCWHHEWVNFRGSACKVYYDLIYPDGLRIFSAKNSSDISNIMLEIRSRFKRQDRTDLIETGASIVKLLSALYALSAGGEDEPTNAAARALADSVRYMEERYSEKITIDDLSEAAKLSKYYYLRAFKKQYGTTPMDYLCGIRLRHARELLTGTSECIEKIARVCGFGDEKNMLYHFKYRQGITPADYRRGVR